MTIDNHPLTPKPVDDRETGVQVTQADREAYLSLNMLPEFDAADVRAGRWDNVTGVQAFARHREQAERELRDEIDRLSEVLKWIAVGDTQVFDDDLQCLVEVAADPEEMSAAARKALDTRP